MSMMKKLLALSMALFATMAMAAVDVNKATEAELDALDGVGPVTSKLIMSERKKAPFKDWADFIARVKGVGDTKAAKLSAGGMTVNGGAYTAAAAAKADAKADAKAKTDKPMTEKVADGAKAAGDKTKEVAGKAADKTKEVGKDAKAAVTPDSKK